MKQASFSNFQVGMVDDPSVEDRGGFEFASGMDIFSEPGVVKASLAMVPVTLDPGVGTLNAIPSAMVDVTTNTNTNTLAYIAMGAKILASNDMGINNGTTWTLFLTNANGSNLDLAIYGDRLDAWRAHSLSDMDAKAAIYDAFVREKVDCPRHLMRDVDRNYFEPAHDEFRPRTLYSLQNALTSAFHKLDPIPMHRATSSAGEYFAALQ